MTVTARAQLQAALEARLGPAAAAALAALPPEARLKSLAHALSADEDAALAFLAESTGLSVLPEPAIDPEGLRLIPARLAASAQVAPVLLPGSVAGRLDLASPWPPEAETQSWAATFSRRRPRWHLAPADRVGQLIRENYGVGSGSLGDDEADDLPVAEVVPADTEADADAAVVRFVTDVLTQAVAERATDVHFEPQEGALAIRFRIDGMLVPVPLPDNLARFQDAILSRLKIMARLNISERRLPQDGRIQFRDGRNSLDIRVSTMPTLHAESISLRLLNQRKEAYDMGRVGMGPDEQTAVRRVLAYPHGIVLVTGPTGSGKSTTLASMIHWINEHNDGHIVTIEDPIEYYHTHRRCVVTQREVHSDVPSFAEGVRSALRQDPDVILIGELRDLETIEAAVSAAETGHLVFGTLHTTGAARTVDRILDAFPAGSKDQIRVQLASSIVAVISQSLCRTLDGKRVAAYEILIKTDAIAAKIRENKTFQIVSDIETGGSRGMRTLDADLLALVQQTRISAEEALVHCQDSETMRGRLKEAGKL